MWTLAGTSLSTDERALPERLAAVARARLGDSLHAIWLFGSRARGEGPAHEASDIDLLVLVEDASCEGKTAADRAFDEDAEELTLEGAFPVVLGPHPQSEWLEGRRGI